MTSRDFCYWLQGYFELSDVRLTDNRLTVGQTEAIQKHLAMVFKHEIDPKMGDQAHLGELNQVHNGVTSSGGPLHGPLARC